MQVEQLSREGSVDGSISTTDSIASSIHEVETPTKFERAKDWINSSLGISALAGFGGMVASYSRIDKKLDSLDVFADSDLLKKTVKHALAPLVGIVGTWLVYMLFDLLTWVVRRMIPSLRYAEIIGDVNYDDNVSEVSLPSTENSHDEYGRRIERIGGIKVCKIAQQEPEVKQANGAKSAKSRRSSVTKSPRARRQEELPRRSARAKTPSSRR